MSNVLDFISPIFISIEILTHKCFRSVVLRSSRDPSNPTKSKPRNSDGLHKPDSNCATSPFDDVDDLIFEVLPSLRPKDACLLNPLVTLDSNLECHERECTVSTLRVVEVIQGEQLSSVQWKEEVGALKFHSFIIGVFYEYLHLPCVHLPFYNNSVKVFSGSVFIIAMPLLYTINILSNIITLAGL